MASNKTSGATMTFQELKQYLDEGVPRQKNRFIAWAQEQNPRVRVGGPVGPGRLTAGQALKLLGVK